jgi:hypothetical protein
MYDYGTCALRLALDIDDPLPPPTMDIIRNVVRDHGAKTASELKNLSYDTPPMVEATAGGECGVLLNLSLSRRAKQAQTLLQRHRHLWEDAPRRTDDPGVGQDLLEEMAELAALRGRVNAEELHDQ